MNNSRCYLNILSKSGSIVSGAEFNRHLSSPFYITEKYIIIEY